MLLPGAVVVPQRRFSCMVPLLLLQLQQQPVWGLEQLQQLRRALRLPASARPLMDKCHQQQQQQLLLLLLLLLLGR